MRGEFSIETVRTWERFLKFRNEELSDKWIFRGQPSDWPLMTSLERACNDSDIELRFAPRIEERVIRDFRRRYEGQDRDLVMSDELYCLALMQHHGAPTRLQDWTYSPFVAAYFALESLREAKIKGKRKRERVATAVVWAVNQQWIGETVKAAVGEELYTRHNIERNDDCFRLLYRQKEPKTLVVQENPFPLNRRLIIQQGAFLCPTDLSKPFEENLKGLPNFDVKKNLVKVVLHLTNSRRLRSLEELHKMNVDRASLFPGLDGFSESLKHRLPFFKKTDPAK